MLADGTLSPSRGNRYPRRTMRAAGDDSFDEVPPRAQAGDLSAPRSAGRRNADPLAALSRFVSEGAVEQAARARSRLRWQHQLAIEEGTWLGVLCDLAESGASVAIDTGLGRRLTGSLTAVGADFVVLATSGGIVVLAIGAISAIQRSDGRSGPLGRAGAPSHTTLHEVLSGLAADRPSLTWHLDDRTTLRGRLVGVGQGFVHLRTDGSPPSTKYVPIGDRAMIVLDG
jgi:hypothetical protein